MSAAILPGSGLFLTDGGLETELVFHDGIELPAFAAFVMLDRPGGRERLNAYYAPYLATARARGMGFVLEAPTWRANPEWIEQAGYDRGDLDRINREAVALMAALRDRHAGNSMTAHISGCIGPRGDGYIVGDLMTTGEAADYHGEQIAALQSAGVDMVSAFTLTNVPEAIGVTRAAAAANVPAVISFTVETDGRLPSEQALGDAIAEVNAATGGGPAYYMVNCAHPTHFIDVLGGGASWCAQIRGIRANASCRSHAELDAADEIDEGNPEELGRQYGDLQRVLPNLRVIGGCCGTDHRHVEQMSLNCV